MQRKGLSIQYISFLYLHIIPLTFIYTNKATSLLTLLQNRKIILESCFYSYDDEAGKMDSGYPRSIEDDFPGIGDEVDAASYHYGGSNLLTNE